MAVGQAGAALVPEPPRPAFYEAPSTLPANNGDVIRTEPLTFAADPAQISPTMLTSTKLMYRSTNHDGKPIAVTGSLIVPKAPWVGPGTRPLISYAAGTQGLADRCAPSRNLAEGIEYEGIFISGLLARGYAVVMTDYEGLGTAGVHTYMNRLSQGHVVLDAARAAQRVTGSGLTPTTPVATVGYSQGGGASASAAELAGSYAPELNLKGSVAGAVPADLGAVQKNLDGGLWSEFALFGLVGMAAAYGVDIDNDLNAKGIQVTQEAQSECVFDFHKHAFLKSATLTKSGQTFSQLAQSEPTKSIIAANRIGNIAPKAPVLVTHSVLDDTIPYAVGRQMGLDWCARGAQGVWFSPNFAPAHLGGMLSNSIESYLFLEARFAGVPASTNCGWF